MLRVFFIIIVTYSGLQATGDLPDYRYFFDQNEHVWRIESDSAAHAIAAWDVPPDAALLHSVAWSPSGAWLAWQMETRSSQWYTGITHLSGTARSLPAIEGYNPRVLRWVGDDLLLIVISDHVSSHIMLFDVNQDAMRFDIEAPFTLPLVETTVCEDLACSFLLPGQVTRQILLRTDHEGCRMELVRTSSHSTMLIHAHPRVDFETTIGTLNATCYGICYSSVPVTGYLPAVSGDGIRWYQVDYMGMTGWVDIHDDATLINACDALPELEVSGS